MCSWSLIIILTKGKFVDQSDPWTWLRAISGHSNEDIFHMGQTMKNNFDFTVLKTRQLTTTLPLVMTECSLHGMEMSVNNSILVTRVVKASRWNAPFLHETSTRNQSLWHFFYIFVGTHCTFFKVSNINTWRDCGCIRPWDMQALNHCLKCLSPPRGT